MDLRLALGALIVVALVLLMFMVLLFDLDGSKVTPLVGSLTTIALGLFGYDAYNRRRKNGSANGTA